MFRLPEVRFRLMESQSPPRDALLGSFRLISAHLGGEQAFFRAFRDAEHEPRRDNPRRKSFKPIPSLDLLVSVLFRFGLFEWPGAFPKKALLVDGEQDLAQRRGAALPLDVQGTHAEAIRLVRVAAALEEKRYERLPSSASEREMKRVFSEESGGPATRAVFQKYLGNAVVLVNDCESEQRPAALVFEFERGPRFDGVDDRRLVAFGHRPKQRLCIRLVHLRAEGDSSD